MNELKEIDKVEEIKKIEDIPTRLPVLPLRDSLVLPYMLFPILVGRELSVEAVEQASKKHKYILLIVQKDNTLEDPAIDDLYRVGTVARILQVLKLPNGLLKVLVDGVAQGFVKKFFDENLILHADYSINLYQAKKDVELDAYVKHATQLFKDYVHNSRDIPPETVMSLDNMEQPDRKFYYILANLDLPVPEKMDLFELKNLRDQYEDVIKIMTEEINILKIEQEIDDKVQDSIQKNQRKYWLQEQVRIMQDELGDETPTGEIAALKEKIEKAKMPDLAKARAVDELDKLKRTQPFSPEATVIRNYLDWLIDVPWHEKTHDNLDVEHAKKILDEDHYGLEKPKERLLEQIAVLNLVKEMRSQILCFVGPPGVGKTSLAKSIARALGRKFVRLSLGGIRDEAEIRGHRRTYVGSLPGRILQAMKRAGVVNPVMLLDEVDKMSSDFHGDPSAALLEALDPEQNHSFQDHYLEVDYDLSKVLFITTANIHDNIPVPLEDRMEVIDLPGYLDYDKIEIAKSHIVPRQLKAHGIDEKFAEFEDAALMRVIREYTWEAGVRNLERSIAGICRKIAKEIVAQKNGKASERQRSGSRAQSIRPVLIDEKKVEEFLGVPKFHSKQISAKSRMGVAVGLAWTSGGGDILNIEAVLIDGPDRVQLTGRLGSVMQESAKAALTYVRANAARLGIRKNFDKGKEIHIHVPEGATPKDGPSAGLTMAIALISAAGKKLVHMDVAMTGEINLNGEVLQIGGLTEKLLAAKRYGVKKVLIPKENVKDLAEVPEKLKEGITIVPVERIEDALKHVFVNGKINK
ncbi:MAG TPA: endopeptidase La [Candidatus Acidoferrales bacterium]|nr:endopeptidase La [Candidatus Acidoferrales bacterium]